jgi:hypothetical protein
MIVESNRGVSIDRRTVWCAMGLYSDATQDSGVLKPHSRTT